MLELRRRYSGSAGGGQPSRLPAGYQEVEYLENTSSISYINLGIKMQEDKLYSSKVDFEFSGKFNGGYNACIDGFYGVSPKDGFPAYCSMLITTQDSTIFSYTANTKLEELQVIYSNNIITKRHVLEFNTANGSFIDGVNYSTETLKTHTSYDGKDSFFLFTRGARNGTLKVETFFGKIYSYIFYEDGVAIRDLIPCYRKSDKVTGMYDIVNDVFYTNAGTGEFLVGADVDSPKLPSEYQEVEYLKSDGSQYIDTGIILKQGCRIEIKYQILDTSSTSWLFVCGARDNLQTRIELTYNHSKTDYAFIYGTSIIVLPLDKINDNTILICDDEKLTLNDIEYSVNTSRFNIQSRFYLFNCNQGSGTGSATVAPCRIEYVKITNDGVDYAFYPCYRREDNVAGMYDLVSGKFYTNAGTGEFIVGPLVI